MWTELAYEDVIRDLSWFYDMFTISRISEAYKSYLEIVRQYAFTQHSKTDIGKTPIENLNHISEEGFGISTLEKIPVEYREFVIEEVRNQISSLSGENYKLFIPISDRSSGFAANMNTLADIIAQNIAEYHKRNFSVDSLNSIFLDSNEVTLAVDDAVKGNEEYDDSAKALLHFKVRSSLKNLGLF
jgi:hypothetical protein